MFVCVYVAKNIHLNTCWSNFFMKREHTACSSTLYVACYNVHVDQLSRKENIVSIHAIVPGGSEIFRNITAKNF